MKTIILMATILLSNVYAQHSLSIQVCYVDIEVTSPPHLFNNKTTVKVSAICEKELK